MRAFSFLVAEHTYSLPLHRMELREGRPVFAGARIIVAQVE